VGGGWDSKRANQVAAWRKNTRKGDTRVIPLIIKSGEVKEKKSKTKIELRKRKEGESSRHREK